VFELIIHPCTDLVFTSNEMLSGKGGWPFIIVYLLQRFSFFYLFCYVFVFSRFTVCLCACVFRENFMCALHWEIFLLPEYDKKKNIAKKDKASDVLDKEKLFVFHSFRQSMAFFCSLAFHFVDSFNLFFVYMSLSEEEIGVQFKLFERFCVRKKCLNIRQNVMYM